jgi:predicted ATPase
MTTEHGARAEIRTPEQRLRVFVSSTLAELAEERAAVARAISALRLTPVMFELGARPHAPQEVYRAYLAQSDIFIGLYWQRYGWIGPGMNISGLEDELRLSHLLPRLLYVKTPAPDREPRLTAMIADLQTEATDSYRSFRSPRELGRLVRDDLALLLSERFTTTARDADRSALPAPNVARRGLRSLPVTSTSLIGRQHDIIEVSNLLESPEVRLVTLAGPGGIGKTRLAIAVGEQLDDRSPRRSVFVALASIAQPELVLPRVAVVVGATIEGTRSPLDALTEHFTETPTLLVLDNLEQVVGVAPALDQLLSGCPGLKVLATSRTVLRLRAEREYPVGALTVPVFSEPPPIEQLASLPAVQLFVDRAQAVRYDFALTEGNAMAVVEICRRLDGLPLAIELAAARTRLLEPVALLARLENVLDALGAGPVDLPERQRTLRATVEWSIGLLDDAEQHLLATLSVFVDGWTVAAATHVSEHTEDQTLDLLDALARHSLVNVIATDAGPRFRMLTLVRELAAERLAASANQASVEQRHTQSTSVRSWRTPTGPLNDRPTGPNDYEPRKRTCESPSVGSSPTTSHRCHTSSACFGSSGRCSIGCQKAAPGLMSYGLKPTHWMTAPKPRCCSPRPSPPLKSVTTTAPWPQSRASNDSKGASTTRTSRAPFSWPSRGPCRSLKTSMVRCTLPRPHSPVSAGRTSRSRRLRP